MGLTTVIGVMKNVAARIEPLSYAPPYSAGLLEEIGVRGLHVGCGPNFFERTWLNTDIKRISDECGTESTDDARLTMLNGEFYYLKHDATKIYPFEAESFEWIYSEHFIEHISLVDAYLWLKECRRLLKPGGLMRFSTPNLQLYLKSYVSGNGPFFKEHQRRLMGMFRGWLDTAKDEADDNTLKEAIRLVDPSVTDSHFRQMEKNSVLRGLVTNLIEENSTRPAFLVNQIFQMWGHRWIYDFDEIKFISQKAGFAPDAVSRRYYRQGRQEQLFNLDDPLHNDESIYVELRKK